MHKNIRIIKLNDLITLLWRIDPLFKRNWSHSFHTLNQFVRQPRTMNTSCVVLVILVSSYFAKKLHHEQITWQKFTGWRCGFGTGPTLRKSNRLRLKFFILYDRCWLLGISNHYVCHWTWRKWYERLGLPSIHWRNALLLL